MGEQEIRRVTVEFLRRGPLHNQLLSPLTDYLAVCEDFPAGIVHVPYEHAEVQNLLSDLRYEVEGAVASPRMQIIRERVGTNIAWMLGSISGLPGSLRRNSASRAGLTHLRLVMSAAELALLPFEMTKVPVSAAVSGEEWLGLQPSWPVCITRRVRGVRLGAQRWPTTPRILFVAGPDVPFMESLTAFADILRPWERIDAAAGADGLTTRYLTARPGITTQELTALLRSERFTHVHVLAHGAKLRDDVERYGLQFEDRPIGGADLALALTTAVRPCLPAVVTVAACDSGQQGSVVVPGGSVAYELHTAGVPVVVASQFPISEEASVPFVTTLYEGFVSGEHPLHSLAALRRRLAVQFPDEHAWASVVAYECLPRDFDDQLAEVRYWQTRRALETALNRLEILATPDDRRVALIQQTGRPFPDDFRGPDPEVYRQARADVDAAMSTAPPTGPWAAECAGLLAAARKRTAEVAFWLSLAPDLAPEAKRAHLAQSVEDLRESLRRYRASMASMLGSNNATVHRKATAHWLIGQVLALDALLGHGVDDGLSATLRVTAGLDLDLPDPGERAWANGSLLECALLQLTKTPPPPDAAEQVMRVAQEIVRLCGPESEQVFSTRRQVHRYLYWWGHPDFGNAITVDDRSPTAGWDRPGGVLPTAREVVAIFTQRSSRTG